MLSNYPPGAIDDDNAPYNEREESTSIQNVTINLGISISFDAEIPDEDPGEYNLFSNDSEAAFHVQRLKDLGYTIEELQWDIT